MKDIVIAGAGGFGREVEWLLSRINKKEPMWNLLGYIDDNSSIRQELINGYPVLGGTEYLLAYQEPLAVVCAIGAASVRKKLTDKLVENHRLTFPNLIDPSVKISDLIVMGKGNILCAEAILTVNIVIEDFVVVNLDCTVGHDARLCSWVTLYPSVNVSGGVEIGPETEIGTGTNIIQGRTVGSHTIIGAGSVVVRDIPKNCTAVGVPCRPLTMVEINHG